MYVKEIQFSLCLMNSFTYQVSSKTDMDKSADENGHLKAPVYFEISSIPGTPGLNKRRCYYLSDLSASIKR